MSKAKETKTNAMRILDRMKIPYVTHTYECETFTDAQQIADLLQLPHEIMYKTLVTVSPDRSYFVFVLPIDAEVDLKKAAREASQKSLAMIHVKEINQVTGYIRGGCTAIGMKKAYPVFIEETARSQERIIVSGGKLGTQIELAPDDLQKACQGIFCSFCIK